MDSNTQTGLMLLLLCTGVPFVSGALLAWWATYTVLRRGWLALLPEILRRLVLLAAHKLRELASDD
jgi:hypothetical protein